MAKLDQLLSGLKAEGEVAIEGGFTLDRDKAREKMRQFQLPDPRRYVLLLVQSAVHKRARKIEFVIDADDMRMTFDGEAFGLEDLDDLYTAILGERDRPGLRARQELALALNAAMALNPRFIRFQSQAQGRAVRAELRPGRTDVIEEVDPDPRLGDGPVTTIHVKERFRAGLVLKFFRDIRGNVAEEVLLREACAFAETPIILDGAPISGGLRLPGVPLVSTRIEARELTGRAGLMGGDLPRPAMLVILTAGVRLAEHPLSGEFPDGFVAMVDGTELRKDVSQSDVVKDARYEAMVSSLRKSVDVILRQLILGLLGREGIAGQPRYSGPRSLDEAPPWLEGLLRRETAARGPITRLDQESWKLGRLLMDLPLWRSVEGTRVSTAELHRGNRDVVYVSETPDADIPSAYLKALYAPHKEEVRLLERLFDDRLKDRTRALARDIERERKRRSFLARKQQPVLAQGLYRARVSIGTERFRGEVGLRMHGTQHPSISIIKDGCLLQRIECDLEELGVVGLTAAIEGDFRPTADWDRSHRDDTLAEALIEIASATQEAIRIDAVEARGMLLMHEERRRFILAFAALATDLARAMLRMGGFSKQRQARYINAFESRSRRPARSSGSQRRS